VSHRVLTFSLRDEPAAGWARLGAAPRLDDFADQIAEVLDDRGLSRAAVCGVSFGGRIAIRFAARWPDRVAALVVASTPGPSWHLRTSHRLYTRAPLVCAPLFAAGAPLRLRREIAVAIPDRATRLAFRAQLLRLLLTRPVSPTRMAARARLIDGVSSASDCARVAAPALLVTGEAGLDHVVPASGMDEYARLMPAARRAILKHTGHLGSITRPDEFARIVSAFLCDAGLAPRSGRHAA